MVPYAQPSRTLHLFSSFVLNKRFPNTTRPSIENWIMYIWIVDEINVMIESTKLYIIYGNSKF
jgi:hypothetical protein